MKTYEELYARYEEQKKSIAKTINIIDNLEFEYMYEDGDQSVWDKATRVRSQLNYQRNLLKFMKWVLEIDDEGVL